MLTIKKPMKIRLTGVMIIRIRISIVMIMVVKDVVGEDWVMAGVVVMMKVVGMKEVKLETTSKTCQRP
jgi:hypothetical protein